LTLTLVTVAVAMLGLQAMAMAPVIGNIPSPVVGQTGNVTGPNQFVYPDAIDLRQFVSDDTLTPTMVKWSYEVVGTQIYSINGVAPVAAGEDPTNPDTLTGNKQINAGFQGSEVHGPVNNPNSITVRNKHLSPLTGTAPTLTGQTTGTLSAETQLVTFIASDGSSYTTKEVEFYTAWGQPNHLSGNFKTNVLTYTFGGGVTNGFTSSNIGTVSPIVLSWTHGMCLTTTKRNTPNTNVLNIAEYDSPLGAIPIVDNAVYRIRLTMNGSNAAVGATPFWDVMVTNPYIAGPPAHGANCYGSDLLILDNTGGANGMTTAAKTFDYWWAPPAITTAQWRDTTNGAFRPSLATDLESRLSFRALEADSTAAVSNWLKGGDVCITNVTIDRWDIGSMTVGANDWNVDSTVGGGFAQATGTSGGNVDVRNVDLGNGVFAASFTGGALTLTPPSGTTNASNQLAYVFSQVGTANENGYDYSQPYTDATYWARITNNFPVPWKANTLYQITANLGAATLAAETNPPDAIEIGMSDPSNEVNMYNLTVTEGGTASTTPGLLNPGPGAPRYNGGVTQPFRAFFWSQTPSAAGSAPWQHLRPLLIFINSATVTNNGNNTGAVTLTKFSVDEVTFP
jgi:hypothetical protein